MRTLRQLLHRFACRRRQPVAACTESVLRGVECLEARCVLSSAPAGAEFSGELQLHDIPPIEFDDALLVVSWGSPGADRLDVLQVIGPIAAGGETGVGAIAVRIAPDFPAISGVGLGIANAAIIKYFWGDSGTPFDAWSEMPSSVPGRYLLPPSQAPSKPNPLGGYIDIGAAGEAAPSMPFIGDDTDQVRRDVLAMLSSLSYVPGDGRGEAVSRPQGSSHPSGAAQLRKSDASAPPNPGPAEHLVTEATNDAQPSAAVNLVDGTPSRHDASEGGMVALPRETVIDEAFAASTDARVDVDVLLSVPVQMESVYGRFQAFEVLSAEEASSSAPSARSTKDSATDAPATDAATLPPEPRSDAFDVEYLPADIAFVKFDATEGSRKIASPQASDASGERERSELIETSGAADAPSAARVPREDEEEDAKTTSLAKATVAAIAVAAVVRVAAARSDASKRLAIEDRLF